MASKTIKMKISAALLAIILFSISAVYGVGSMGKRSSLPLSSLVTKPNTTYRIDKEYSLDGEKFEIPSNCTFIFTKNGRLNEGELIGNETKIRCEKNSLGVKLSGSWCVDTIRDEWFNSFILNDNDIIYSINALQCDTITQTITLKKPRYHFLIEGENGSGLVLSSNTILDFKGTTLKLKTNNLTSYNIINIKGKKNIVVKGGKIVGDVVSHSDLYEGKSEWGTGVNIENSDSVSITDLYITHCWGDGIYIGGGAERAIGQYEKASKNIVLKNVICDDNRRQGISITHVDGLLADHCSFINTGVTKKVSPAAGVDIEPNLSKGRNQSCRDMNFVSCVMKGNKGKVFTIYHSLTLGGVNNVENIKIYDCDIDGRISFCSPSIAVEKSRINALLTIRTYGSPAEVTFKDCQIKSDNVNIDMVPTLETVTPSYDVTFQKCDVSIKKIKDALPAMSSDNRIRIQFIDSEISMPKGLSKQIIQNQTGFDAKVTLNASNVIYK